MDTLQEYLEKRILEAICQHASGIVDMHFDNEDPDRVMQQNDYRKVSVEETVDSFIQMAVDFFLENDMLNDGVVIFKRDKVLEMGHDLIKSDKPTEAYLAQCALMLRGYAVSAKSMGLLSHYVGQQFREN